MNKWVKLQFNLKYLIAYASIFVRNSSKYLHLINKTYWTDSFLLNSE